VEVSAKLEELKKMPMKVLPVRIPSFGKINKDKEDQNRVQRVQVESQFRPAALFYQECIDRAFAPRKAGKATEHEAPTNSRFCEEFEAISHAVR